MTLSPAYLLTQRNTKRPGTLTSRKVGSAGLICLWLASCGGGGSVVKPPVPPVPPTPPAPVIVTPPPIPAAARGGSNILSVHVGQMDGFIVKFDTLTTQIDSELRTMYANGQRRLKIPLLFYHGSTDGVAVDSTGGMMSDHDTQNLLHLLQLIRSIGYEQVQIEFLPEWWNDPEWWVSPGAYNSPGFGNCNSVVVGEDGVELASMKNDWYGENWSFVSNTRQTFLVAGMKYVVSPMGEGMDPRFLAYVRRLWIDYTATFGKDDTIGYSVVPTAANIALIPQVYSGNLPTLMDLHIYDNNTYGNQCDITTPGSCTYAAYVAADQALAKAGYTGPVIVGEVFYNDSATAQALVRARATTGRAISWVTQWPLTRTFQAGQNEDVIPADFSGYMMAGF